MLEYDKTEENRQRFREWWAMNRDEAVAEMKETGTPIPEIIGREMKVAFI